MRWQGHRASTQVVTDSTCVPLLVLISPGSLFLRTQSVQHEEEAHIADDTRSSMPPYLHWQRHAQHVPTNDLLALGPASYPFRQQGILDSRASTQESETRAGSETLTMYRSPFAMYLGLRPVRYQHVFSIRQPCADLRPFRPVQEVPLSSESRPVLPAASSAPSASPRFAV